MPRTMEEHADALEKALRDVAAFLMKKEWGTYQYMEGWKVYNDIDDALLTISVALGEDFKRPK